MGTGSSGSSTTPPTEATDEGSSFIASRLGSSFLKSVQKIRL